jgi:hypothetical protein
MALVRTEGLSQREIPMTPWRIEPMTFRLVTQYLNQLRHVAPPEQNLWRRKRRRARILSTRGALRSWHLDLSTSYVPVLNSNNIQTNPHTLLAFILSIVPTLKTERMLVHSLLLNVAARFVTTIYWLRNFSPFVHPTVDQTTC